MICNSGEGQLLHSNNSKNPSDSPVPIKGIPLHISNDDILFPKYKD